MEELFEDGEPHDKTQDLLYPEELTILFALTYLSLIRSEKNAGTYKFSTCSR